MITDPSERGIERRICAALTGSPRDAALAQQGPNGKAAVPSGGEGWVCAHPGDYDRNYTVDLAQLIAFLAETQPDAYKALQLKADSPVRRKFLARLQSEVGKRGVMTCYARGLITVRITLSSSTARPLPATPSPLNATPRTDSRSPANSAIASTSSLLRRVPLASCRRGLCQECLGGGRVPQKPRMCRAGAGCSLCWGSNPGSPDGSPALILAALLPPITRAFPTVWPSAGPHWCGRATAKPGLGWKGADAKFSASNRPSSWSSLGGSTPETSPLQTGQPETPAVPAPVIRGSCLAARHRSAPA